MLIGSVRVLGAILTAMSAICQSATADEIASKALEGAGTVSLSRSGVFAKVTSTSFLAQDVSSEIVIRVHGNLVYDRKESQSVSSVTLVPFAGSSIPLVDVQFFSGGAHCCFSDLYIEPADNAADVQWSKRDWGDYPPEYTKLGDDYVLRGIIGTAYEFGSFGGSTGPLVILKYRDHALHDVTTLYPKALEKDARERLADYSLEERSQRTGEASLASYLADEERLGNSAQAWVRVRRMYAGNDFLAFSQHVRRWLQSVGIASN